VRSLACSRPLNKIKLLSVRSVAGEEEVNGVFDVRIVRGGRTTRWTRIDAPFPFRQFLAATDSDGLRLLMSTDPLFEE
jgi:hypothetical protein